MAKKNKNNDKKISEDQFKEIESKLPKDAQKKLKEIKSKLEKFKNAAVKKFEDYIIGIALLPPKKPEKEDEQPPEDINVLVLVDDSDSKKMSKEELKEKLSSIIQDIAKNIDEKLKPQTIILSELWQSCYDAKYDMLEMIAMSAPVHDNGMLSAVKIAEIHKSMVVKKFEKYIVSYVLAGSLVQGRATPRSDIDVFIVVDDTDVKKMTRAELKDKLRAIIIQMGLEAGEMTGIKNKLNVQVYILTDFWENIKEANPIIFTFLRDGIPFYDRGIFMPWKQLLKMGKIKPSTEAIDMYMHSGTQMLKAVKAKIRDLGMEDIYWAILTPSQAALMLYGVPPPTPKETPDLIRQIFVKKEKMLEEKYVKILEKNIQIRKDCEHGSKKELSGKEIDGLLDNAEDYLKRIKKLFGQIEKTKEQESIVHLYETASTIVRDVLKIEGVYKVKDSEIDKVFNEEMICKGKVPAKFLRIFRDIIKAKKDYDQKKLTKTEVEKVKKNSQGFIRFMVEYIQRKRGIEIEKAKIRIKYGEKYGEVLLLGDKAYIIHDIDSEEKTVTKADLKQDGSMDKIKQSSFEELEKDIANMENFSRVFIKEPIFEDMRKLFGKNVEILVNY
jgi:uncharacterized protein (UPF0332 family)/predicted nucleotidyltransferase